MEGRRGVPPPPAPAQAGQRPDAEHVVDLPAVLREGEHDDEQRPGDTADDERVTRLWKDNEYKRRQAPVGPRITHRAFGKDWRYPITNRFR